MKQFIKIIFILISTVGFAQKISVSGNLNLIASATSISDAGNNLPTSYVSTNNASIVTIEVVPPSKSNKENKPLRVFVHKVDTNWHTNLILQVRRTVLVQNSNITLGTVFQTVTNNSTLFFNTIGEHFNIPIQYNLSGISLLMPANNYTTTVVYTVLDV